MPAYHAGRTVEKMAAAMPRDIVDEVIFVDDASGDDGYEKAVKAGLTAFRNEKNLNYGGNVKRCLQLALDRGADIAVLLHPDCQYTPSLVPAMAAMLCGTPYDLCLASRTSGAGTISAGMPFWRYLPNRVITTYMSWCLGVRHTEYHTGYRAYSRKLLEAVPFHSYRNDFIFDNQFIAQALWRGSMIGEVSCPTKYFAEASSINFRRSVVYGIGCLRVAGRFFLSKKLGFPAPAYLGSR
jgi:glycosyltransferase involved in cell wall biosynthesis